MRAEDPPQGPGPFLLLITMDGDYEKVLFLRSRFFFISVVFLFSSYSIILAFMI